MPPAANQRRIPSSRSTENSQTTLGSAIENGKPASQSANSSPSKESLESDDDSLTVQQQLQKR